MADIQSIVIRPDDLRFLEAIARREGISAQEALDSAISNFIDAKQREHFPETAALIDRTICRNRRLYELLAE